VTGKSKVTFKNTFSFISVPKQHIKIKIIAYLCLITKADHQYHNAVRDLGLMACSDLIFTNPIVFSVDVPGFFPLMVGSSG
jgi:hypothetical protein